MVRYKYRTPGYARLISFVPMTALVLAIFALSGMMFMLTRSWEQDQDRSAVARLEQRLTAGIGAHLDAQVQALRMTAAFYEVKGGFAKDEILASFLTKSGILADVPGVQGVGFARHLQQSEIDEYVRKTTRARVPFQLFPAGARARHVVVEALFPMSWENRRRLGFDMYSENQRRQAMERAWQTGLPTISAPFEMAATTGLEGELGFCLFMPVAQVTTPASAPWRVLEPGASLGSDGFIFAPLHAASFFRTIARKAGLEDQLGFEVADGETGTVLVGSLATTQAPLERVVTLNLYGRSWRVRVWPLAPMGLGSSLPFVVGLFGLTAGMITLLLLRAYERKNATVHALLESSRAELVQRRRVNSELLLANERYRVVAGATNDLIMDVDVKSGRLVWSGEFGWIGLRQDAFVQDLTWLHERVHPADRQAFDDAWSALVIACQLGMPLKRTYRLRRGEGGYARILERGCTLASALDGGLRYVGVLQDLGPLEAAAAALARSEDRLSLAVESMAIGSFEFDAPSGVLWLSERAREMLGVALEDERVRPIKILSRLDRAVRRSLMNLVVARHGEACETKRLEFALSTEDGPTVRWLELHGRTRPVAEGGRRHSLAGVVLDVTARVQAAEALKSAKEAAESANRTKSLFLANMSHEIRTPLGVILGYASLLREPDLDPAERQRFHELIERSGKQLQVLIDDILDLSKIEVARIEIEAVAFSLRELLDDLVEVFAPMASQRGVNFGSVCAADLPQSVTSDPTRVRQILSNLISNAIKFSQPGGRVSLAARCEPGGGDAQAVLCFEVEDDGIGVSEEARARLFRPFTQADASMTRRYGGSGLGLLLSRRLAEALGGTVELVRSEPGAGSLFRARCTVGLLAAAAAPAPRETLQAAAGGLAAAARAGRAPQGNGTVLGGLNILLAEDALENQEMFRRALTRRGASVMVVENGAAALTAAGAARFDVVVLDIQMPVMDGLEAARALRARGYAQPLIALTAHALREERDRCLRAGFNEHVTKPVNFDRLATTIQGLARHGVAMPSLDQTTTGASS